MPVREAVLARRQARKHRGGLGAKRLVARVADLQERPHVAGEPVDGADALEARAPDPLRPEAVSVAPRRERVGRLAGQVVPAHRDCGDERSRRPEHEVVGLAGEVGRDARTQVVFEVVTEPARDEEDSGLADEQGAFGRVGSVLHDVRFCPPALESTRSDGGKVERCLG